MRLAGAHPRPAAAQPRPRCRLNRVVQHHWTAYGASPGLRDGFDYGYDANSNRLWRANLTAQALDKPFDELYAYDQLNRLVDFQRGTLNAEHTAILDTPTKEQTWNLDPTGNWSQFTSADEGVLETDQTRISNPANEITEISSWFPPGYDHAGNMMRIPKPAAPQEGFLATWDAWNRMVKLIDAGTSDTVQENAFDAQTWRTVRKDYEAGALSETRHFFYTAQWQSIEERLDAATTPERQHVWGLRYIDDLILRDRDTDDDGDLNERLYAMQDANWNVTGIIDDAGDAQERYVYEAYGMPVQVSSTYSASLFSTNWDYLFTGRSFDNNTSLYFYRRRLLHALLGCFLARDPRAYMDSMRLLSYARGNPTTNIDPTGTLTQHRVDQSFDAYKALTSCGRYLIATEWDPEDISEGRIIIQYVFHETCITPCMANQPITFPDLTLTDEQKAQLNKTGCRVNNPSTKPPTDGVQKACKEPNAIRLQRAYYEVWRVDKDKSVFIDDVFADTPSNKSAVDFFSWFGTSSCTQGGGWQRGSAFFIPDSVWKKKKAALQAMFKKGQLGVDMAGMLASACHTDAKSLVDELWKAAGEPASTIKTTSNTWNCCSGNCNVVGTVTITPEGLSALPDKK